MAHLRVQPDHAYLERSSSARVVVTPVDVNGERCLDIRLWRRSEASSDPHDFSATPAGIVLPVRDVPVFLALVEAASR